MKAPDIDLAELEMLKSQNREERLKFVALYAEWLKKTPNKIWSSQQKDLIG